MVLNDFDINNRKEFLSYLRKNKLTIEKFLISRSNKKDLFTNEPLEFKNEDQYLNSDFNNRENLNNYLLSINKDKARDFCIDFFKKRKARKNLIFALSYIECKSGIFPSINIIQKGLHLDYNEIIKDAGLNPKFNYKGTFKFNELGKLSIIGDTREQKILKFNNIKIQKLNYGDYTVEPPYYSGIFIERKSLQDLIGTLSSKNIDRFKNELARAVEMKSYIIVVVEESFNNLLKMKELSYIRSHVSPDYICNKIRALMELGNSMQFLFVNGRKESVRIIEKIFRLKESVKQIDLQYIYDLGKL